MKRMFLSIVCLLSLSVAQADAKELFTFDGTIDLSSRQFKIDVDFADESFIRAKGLRMSDADYTLNVDIEHVKSPFFDLSSQIQGNLAIAPTGDVVPKVSGQLSSQYSLLDYKPTKELSGQFEIKDNKLFFKSLSFANVAWTGFVEYVQPYKLDMVLEMDKLAMPRFLDLWVPNNHFDSSGTVSGEIRLLGSLNELQMRGNLQAYDGYIESLKFDEIHLTAAGLYPNIEVSQTVISKTDGMSFIVNGPVNISSASNFKKQIEALNVSPLVNQTASKAEWTIKRLRGGSDSATTEFKYLLRNDQSSLAADESALLGVERKLEF